MAGPSTDMSAKIPAAWLTVDNRDALEAMMNYVNPARAVTDELGYQHHTEPSQRKGDSFQIPVNIGLARNVVRNERMKLDIRNECAGVNPDSINER